VVYPAILSRRGELTALTQPPATRASAANPNLSRRSVTKVRTLGSSQ
jgi:hypothetical protein